SDSHARSATKSSDNRSLSLIDPPGGGRQAGHLACARHDVDLRCVDLGMTWFWTDREDRGISEQSVETYLATAVARELATQAIARQHQPADGRRPMAP